MKWRGRRVSKNVEDRRGRRPMGLPMGSGRGMSIGCGGLLLVLLFVFLGGDPQQLIEVIGSGSGSGPGGSSVQAPGGTPYSGGPIGGGAAGSAPEDELGEFAGVVLASTEDIWNVFAQEGREYREPPLVLFSGSVQSRCGFTSAAVGPFYCPADGKVYIDLSFFDDLERRFGAPGDFAQAYVIAHEVGHHIQNLLGISSQVQQARQRMSKTQGNQLSVRAELQADCLAGVWGYYAHRELKLLEPGDMQEGLRAAAAIGDDSIQRKTTGTIRPESWTHGSSEQRVEWLRRGLESGDTNVCDTF